MAVRRKETWRVNVTAYIWRYVDGRFRFLIVRRIEGIDEFSGRWEVPGGGVTREDHEINKICSPDSGKEGTLIIALRREVREETSLRLREIEYVNDYSHPRESDQKMAVGLRYLAQVDESHSTQVVFNDQKHDDHRWVTADQVAEYDLLGDIANQIALLEAMLRRRLVQQACGLSI